MERTSGGAVNGALMKSADTVLHVGRVGILAAALGIGTVVLGSYGATAIAWADTTSSSSSTDGSTSEREKGPRTDESKPRRSAKPAKHSPAADPAEADDGPDADTREKETSESAKSTRTAMRYSKEERPSESESSSGADAEKVAHETNSEAKKAPADNGVVLEQVGNAPDSLTDKAPDPTPLSKVVEWTSLASARRELVHRTVSDPLPTSVTETADGAGDTVTIPQTPTPGYDIPTDWEDAYTGRPSAAHQLLVTGLRVVTAVTEALGIPFNLASPSFRIPFLTDGTPPTFLMPGTTVTKRQYVDEPSGATWDEWVITPEAPTGERVIAVHGGGFTSEANIFTYLTYNQVARDTGATVVVPVYPVIGEGGTAATVVPVMANRIASEVRAYGATNVSVLGDSAGGSISLAALQLQAARIRKGEEDSESMPSRLVLLSPSLDSNDPYSELPFDDPLLDPEVSKQNRVAWLDGLDPTDPLASPVFGSLDGLPPTTVYSSSLDQITFQTLRLRQKAADTTGDFTFVLRKGLIHDWVVFFFLPEAQAELPGIYQALGVHPQTA